MKNTIQFLLRVFVFSWQSSFYKRVGRPLAASSDMKERGMSENLKKPNPVSRRSFLKTSVAKGAAGVAVAAVGLHPKEAEAANSITWHRSADVVVVGAGGSGLAWACAARDTGGSGIMVEENFDIGGPGSIDRGEIRHG